MNWRKFSLEATVLIVAAVLCAVIANSLAARERRLALVGTYGAGATQVPVRPAIVQPPSVATPLDPAAPAGTVTLPPTTTAPVTSVAPVPTTATAPASGPAATAAPAGSSAPNAAAAPRQARASREEILRRFPPHPDVASRDIPGDDAMWLHQQGALFLDARRSSIYEQGHVAGSRSVSVWEVDVDDKVKNLLEQVADQDLPIVVYCSGGACEDSHMLAQKLWGVFFTNVLVYKDGWPDWQQRRGPTATGRQ